ncbi:hypothetical protein K431DRAFT_269957 [Polychaeton citri CBS 116435]|uniref:Zn(2)-C6 fungal-type domain-containing protein n=1 Tax=Polychaeton citri CBS 116435 TaxID=1314669 RepID=A0A9P4UNJ4_9PEZI|nr:hypothetical protein K431DRAFT_269957 [Polychaeton citri CBS 116435]
MPPRLIRPKDEPGTSDGGDSVPEPKHGKRRAVSSACIPCRKRKSKCDGQLPACSTCTAVYRTQCSYDADSDHRRKGALKRDIQTLQQRNDALDVIVASLRTLPEAEAMALLHNIRTETDFDMIAVSLKTNVRLPHSYAPQTLEADFAQQMTIAPGTATFEKIPSNSSYISGDVTDGTDHYGPESATSDLTGSTNSWFSSHQDAEFIEHLLNLYFCWVHPFYHFFAREEFLQDMGQGRSRFCSSLLLNAVLAVACGYSDRPTARINPSNPATAGEHYFSEAKRLLEAIEKPALTTVQALGLMSLFESSKGRDSNGYRLCGRSVRMAVELGLHLSVAGSGLQTVEVEVRKITFWAVFNLETVCAVSLGRLSQLPRSAADIDKPTVDDRVEAQVWRPYEDNNLATNPSAEQPARLILFVNHLSRLSELASDMVNTFYAPRERFTSRRLAATYDQYKEWYDNLPDCFRLENTTLPHVIILHMYYYACVLHLFRPYIKLDLRGAGLFPRGTCTYCANEISSLMNALRAMYGLRRVNLAVTGILLSASTIHLLNIPAEPSATSLVQGLNDFQAMSTTHQFAGRCVDIVRALAAKWNIALPESAAGPQILQGERPSEWPSPPQSTFFVPSISRKQSSGSGQRFDSSSEPSQHVSPFSPPSASGTARAHGIPPPQMYGEVPSSLDGAASSSSQATFWTPFPMQGIPLTAHELVSSSMNMEPMPGHQWAAMQPMEHMNPTHGDYDSRHSSSATQSGEGEHMVDHGLSNWQWQ